MAQDRANFDAVLKTVWGPGIVDLIPQKLKLYDRFKELPSKEWGGRYVEWPVRIGRNEGSGAGTELGKLPAAGKQKYTTARIPMRYFYGRRSFSAQVMKSSQGGRNAFASAMESEMTGMVKDMTAEMGRMVMYDGRGILALVNGDPGTGTTLTLDSPGGVAGAVNGNRFVRPEQFISFINPATGGMTVGTTLGIEQIDTIASTGLTATTISAIAGGIADNDYVVKAMDGTVTDVSDTSYQKEPMGLLGLVDDGTYVPTLHGINRTTHPLWASYVISNVGAISGDVFQRGIDVVDQRGDADIDLLVMHHSVRRSYLASMEEQRRYTGGDLSRPDSGTVAAKRGTLTYGTIPIMEEKYCPYGTVFGLDTSSLQRWVEVPGEWIDEDGSILQRIGSGAAMQDAFEGVYRIWHNFALDRPNTCFRLDGVTANVIVVHID